MSLLLRDQPIKTLRADQGAGIVKLREMVGLGERRIVMMAPTGFGKTVVTADLVRRARAKGKRVLVTVPALSLVDQTFEMLGAQGVTDVGVIQAQHQNTDPSQPVQLASVQTLQRRPAIPQADLVIIDEIHKWFRFYEKWLRDPAWINVPIIGMSATPWTRGLGAYFGKMVVANTIKDMIEAGTLSKCRVFAPDHPDLKGVRTVAGDYHEGDLHERMSKSKLVADIVANWKHSADGRPTICFAVNRAHANQIAKEFEAAGVPAGYMDCDTPLMERATIRNQLLAGRIKVVCNVDVIGLGVDWPEISCIVYARPTKSEMRYVQNIGRGLRTASGKADLVVFDHSDTTLRLGFVGDIHHDTLSDGKPRTISEKVVQLPKECPKCHYLKPPRTALCPVCGTIAEQHAKPIETVAGELVEMNGDHFKVAPIAKQLKGKADTYGQLMFYGQSKGYSQGWAANKYRSIYGVWPRSLDWERHRRAPEMALATWIKSQNIRWAKSNARHSSASVNGNIHANGHGGEEKVLPKSTHGIVPGTLCTDKDLEDFT